MHPIGEIFGVIDSESDIKNCIFKIADPIWLPKLPF